MSVVLPAISPEDHDNLAGLHLKVHLMKYLSGAVSGGKIRDCQQTHTVDPRYADTTSGCRRTSSGVPSAIFLPKFIATTWSEIPMTIAM